MRDHRGRRIDYDGHKTVSCDDGEHRRTMERSKSPNWPVRTEENQFGVELISTDKGGKLTRPSEMKLVERVTSRLAFPADKSPWDADLRKIETLAKLWFSKTDNDATSMIRLQQRNDATSTTRLRGKSTKKLCYRDAETLPFRLEMSRIVCSCASTSSTHLQRLVNFVDASAAISNKSNDFN